MQFLTELSFGHPMVIEFSESQGSGVPLNSTSTLRSSITAVLVKHSERMPARMPLSYFMTSDLMQYAKNKMTTAATITIGHVFIRTCFLRSPTLRESLFFLGQRRTLFRVEQDARILRHNYVIRPRAHFRIRAKVLYQIRPKAYFLRAKHESH